MNMSYFNDVISICLLFLILAVLFKMSVCSLAISIMSCLLPHNDKFNEIFEDYKTYAIVNGCYYTSILCVMHLVVSVFGGVAILWDIKNPASYNLSHSLSIGVISILMPILYIKKLYTRMVYDIRKNAIQD